MPGTRIATLAPRACLLFTGFMLLFPSLGAAQTTDPTSSIHVSGTASVRRQPDQAVVNLSVESFAATAPEASSDNSSKMDAVLRGLRKLGLRGNAIKTMGFNISPEYDYSPNAPRQQGDSRLIGYRVRNLIQVTTSDIALASEIIDVAINSGANRVTGLSFQLQAPEDARREALRLAASKAKREAEAIAMALGVELGPVLVATADGGFSPPQFREAHPVRFMAMDAAETAPPIEPGQLEVSAHVSITYVIKPQGTTTQN